MRYAALAVDFDGTLARDGQVDQETEDALVRLRDSGRCLILVTGRELPDLRQTCPQLPLFDLVVAENGGLLYRPADQYKRTLADSPPRKLVDELARRGVEPVSVGEVVIGTWRPHEGTVLDVIQSLGLEHHVIFNKGAVMILPPTVNKATGLAVALKMLRLSPHNVVAIGDAENDHALFSLAECAVAVANALPVVKERADLVTNGDHGDGVVEIIDQLLANDLQALSRGIRRHDFIIGKSNGGLVRLPTFGATILIAGSSGSGKSTAMLALIEHFEAAHYQYCAIDPEGDYQALENAILIGIGDQPPIVEEVARVLEKPVNDAIACLLRVPLSDRPTWFAAMIGAVSIQRAQYGRPHWLAIDEAHHVIPAWREASDTPLDLAGSILITVDPSHLARAALDQVDILIAIGDDAPATIAAFCVAIDDHCPVIPKGSHDQGQALVWNRTERSQPIPTRLTPPKGVLRRHRRKYARGELKPQVWFRFRGSTNRTHAVACNLIEFIDVAAELGDEDWLFHLLRGDLARWFEETIKDGELASEARRAEAIVTASISQSRAIIRRAIERSYTLPS